MEPEVKRARAYFEALADIQMTPEQAYAYKYGMLMLSHCEVVETERPKGATAQQIKTIADFQAWIVDHWQEWGNPASDALLKSVDTWKVRFEHEKDFDLATCMNAFGRAKAWEAANKWSTAKSHQSAFSAINTVVMNRLRLPTLMVPKLCWTG
jgi:hypothetical protein